MENFQKRKKRRNFFWSVEICLESREDIIGETGRMYTSDGSYIANAYLEVALESSSLGVGEYMLQMRFKNYSRSQEPIPSGRQNRIEWIENNLENIR